MGSTSAEGAALSNKARGSGVHSEDSQANAARVGLLGDFAGSIANSFKSQANGLIQLCGGKQFEMSHVDKAKFGSAEWAAELAGQAVGLATEFTCLRAGFGSLANTAVRGLTGGTITAATDGILGRTLVGAGTGGFMGSALTPSAHDHGFAMFTDRLKQGLSDGATLGIASGIAAGTMRFGTNLTANAAKTALQTGESATFTNAIGRTLANGYVSGAAGGLPGGAFGAAAESELNGEHLNVSQLSQRMAERGIEYALVGAGTQALSSGGAAARDFAKGKALDFADNHISGTGASQKLASFIHHHVSEPLTVAPVTSANVDQAAKAALDGFSYAKDILRPDADFKASLDPKLADSMYGNDPHRPQDAHYYAAMDRHGKVVGTTGLYSYADDPDATWLGWYSVPPEARGRGIGNQLLDFSIRQARQEGRPLLRLYTSDHPGEKVAQYVYEKNGFHITGIDPPNEYGVRIVYRERPLRTTLERKLTSPMRAPARFPVKSPESPILNGQSSL